MVNSHDMPTPNTPWTEPMMSVDGPGHYDPVFYRSSQEIAFVYEKRRAGPPKSPDSGPARVRV